LAAYRPVLLGHEDQPHASFADLFHELVWADDRAGTFAYGRLIDRDGWGARRGFEIAAGVFISLEECLYLLPEFGGSRARLIQVGGALYWRLDFHSAVKDLSNA